MPRYLESLFGRKKPTVIEARAELARVETELAGSPARIAAAEAALKRVADMTAEEHADADERLAAVRREPVRLQARSEDLRAAVAEAEKTEAANALRATAEAARKAMAGMERLLDAFDAQAATLADTAAEISRIDGVVALANRRIELARKAGLDVPEAIKTSHELFRSGSDHVEADREVVDEVWMVPNHRGIWQPVQVFGERDGKQVPVELGAELRRSKRTIPGKRRPGISLAPPTYDLRLPATRLGKRPAWPRPA